MCQLSETCPTSNNSPTGRYECRTGADDRASDALVHQLCKKGRSDHEVTPLGVVCSRWPGCDDLLQRSALFLQRGDVLANANQHVPVVAELGSVADRRPVPWDDDGRVAHDGQIGISGPDGAVDASSGRIVDEWIDTVPVGVAGVQDV